MLKLKVKKHRNSLHVLLLFSMIVSSLFIFSKNTKSASAQETQSVNVPTTALPESDDFATLDLGNAWDMSEFTDISPYLNGAGRHPTLTNISVADGIFSARSIGDYKANLAFFDPLFAGFENFMQLGGNLGSLHPINPHQYDCLYIAMKVNSPTFFPGEEQPDVFRVLWSNKQASGGASELLYPETFSPPFPAPVHNWRLYKINLSHPNYSIPGGANWQDQDYWDSISINPTIFKDIDFQIDWLRITTCGSEPDHQAQISWSPDAAVTTIWARPTGKDRSIMLVTGIDGSKDSYSLDTKGLAAGSYQIGLGTLNDCCKQWSEDELKINQTPKAQVVYPSPLRSQDYASMAGNPWDMEPDDVVRIECADFSFSDGILHLITLPPAALPSSCAGDSQVFFNMPGPLNNASDYRYLSFRLNMEGTYSIPADGMIGRFMWTTPDGCTQVSADIPYDVGWQTYTIDLYDPFNGMPVEAAPSGCPLVPWSRTGKVVQLRFDPNENWTGNLVPEMTFYQHFDWFTLTKPDSVVQGQSYSIGLTLNKPLKEIGGIQYYFTTDPKKPLQFSALRYNNQIVSSLNAAHHLYLPGILNTRPVLPFDSSTPDVRFNWDTSSVSPGTYYICAKVSDSKNESISCSEAPVQINAP